MAAKGLALRPRRVEALEDGFQVVRRDARPVVLDRHHRLPAPPGQAYPHRPAWGAEGAGVVDEVAEYLAEGALATQDPHRLGHLGAVEHHPHLRLAGPTAVGVESHDLGQQAAEVEATRGVAR